MLLVQVAYLDAVLGETQIRLFAAELKVKELEQEILSLHGF